MDKANIILEAEIRSLPKSRTDDLKCCRCGCRQHMTGYMEKDEGYLGPALDRRRLIDDDRRLGPIFAWIKSFAMSLLSAFTGLSNKKWFYSACCKLSTVS